MKLGPGISGSELGMQAYVPGTGLVLPGTALDLIITGLAAAGPQKQFLAWVVAVRYMGLRS